MGKHLHNRYLLGNYIVQESKVVPTEKCCWKEKKIWLKHFNFLLLNRHTCYSLFQKVNAWGTCFWHRCHEKDQTPFYAEVPKQKTLSETGGCLPIQIDSLSWNWKTNPYLFLTPGNVLTDIPPTEIRLPSSDHSWLEGVSSILFSH